VFVSYRRKDTAGYAGRLCEHLCGVFGAGNIFFDVQDIAPGQDFAASIEKTISVCQAVVVVIGPEWTEDLKTRAAGEDFVRREVSAALARNVPVFPVLVGGAAMPGPAELPAGLAALSRRQAVEIRDARFDDDVIVLVKALEQVPGAVPPAAGANRRKWVPILLAAVLLAVVAGVFLLRTEDRTVDISGTWIAEMQKPNQSPYRIRLNLAETNGQLTGNVEYPTGGAAIQAGRREKDGLTFFTIHTPNFASEPATIRWTGTVEGDVIRFTTADDNGIAKGNARRSP
jgi:TIR domain